MITSCPRLGKIKGVRPSAEAISAKNNDLHLVPFCWAAPAFLLLVSPARKRKCDLDSGGPWRPDCEHRATGALRGPARPGGGGGLDFPFSGSFPIGSRPFRLCPGRAAQRLLQLGHLPQEDAGHGLGRVRGGGGRAPVAERAERRDPRRRRPGRAVARRLQRGQKPAGGGIGEKDEIGPGGLCRVGLIGGGRAGEATRSPRRSGASPPPAPRPPPRRRAVRRAAPARGGGAARRGSPAPSPASVPAPSRTGRRRAGPRMALRREGSRPPRPPPAPRPGRRRGRRA